MKNQLLIMEEKGLYDRPTIYGNRSCTWMQD